MKIEAALEQFLLQLEADGRSPHTIGQYRRHVRAFAAWAACVGHSRHVRAVDHQTVARFLAAPQAKCRPDGAEKRPGSVNSLRTSLRGFFGFLFRAGILREDPTRLVRRAICSPPPPRALSDDEARRLLGVLAAADGREARRDHALFHLMLATGIRLSSAIALDASDVDLGRREIYIRTAKGNRPATAYLGDAITEHLRAFLADHPGGALFTGYAGRRISHRHAQRRFTQWLGKAGIKRQVSPHGMRHRFALDLYACTSDVLLVKEALHHRSITSTLVYARADAERVRRAMG